MSENETMYCNITDIKDRMLIDDNDTQYDDALNTAANEASRIVDIFLKPYADVPLNSSNITSQISNITADFGASIFKRRMTPDEVQIRGALAPDMNAEINAVGWFAQGVRKMEMYIKSYYTLQTDPVNNSGGNDAVYTTHNPDIFLTLFERGAITAKEARDYMSRAITIVSQKLDNLTKIITHTENKTVTEYTTKRQKSFAFVSGGEVITGNNNNGAYQKDSETNGSD